MVDAGASDAFWPQDYKWALRTARMLADYGVHWFKEPLPPDNLDDFVLLRNSSPVPIAGGRGPDSPAILHSLAAEKSGSISYSRT